MFFCWKTSKIFNAWKCIIILTACYVWMCGKPELCLISVWRWTVVWFSSFQTVFCRQKKTQQWRRHWIRCRIFRSRVCVGKMAVCLRTKRTGLWIVALNVPAKKEKLFVVRLHVLQWHVPIHPSSMANAVQFAFVSADKNTRHTVQPVLVSSLYMFLAVYTDQA